MLFLTRIFSICVGVFLFYYLAGYFNYIWAAGELEFRNRIGFMLAGSLTGYLFSPYLYSYILKLNKRIDRFLKKISLSDFLSGIFGLAIGFIIAGLFSLPIHLFLKQYYKIGLAISITSCFILGYLGAYIFVRISFFDITRKKDKLEKISPKIIDTSVLIDGRIYELISTGFIEGKMIIADFVLEELQSIADDSDQNKRKRGRKGLEIAQKIKDSELISMEVFYSNSTPFKRTGVVDSDLVSLTKYLNGVLITNDYNLSKMAIVFDVKCFNLIEIVKLLKPVLMPGDRLQVNIVKTGEHVGQGIAYLEDGTMIVVDDGEKFCGKNIEIAITHMVQTSAGILIFAKSI